MAAEPDIVTPYSDISFTMPESAALAARIAVGVSGGPDSMALAKLLSDWAEKNKGPEVHVLIVDHGLRPESAQEAEGVVTSLGDWNHVKPTLLKWEGEKPGTAIQEEARKARYALMAAYCKEQGIHHLFLAHHQDDQAETFLFRLAKGSGLDGLSAMKKQQAYDENLTVLRPLLDSPKAQLVEFCSQHDISFVQDPSNESCEYARVRIRQSMDVLENEGLSAKRLSVTAARLNRARTALEEITKQALEKITLVKETDRIVLSSNELRKWPEEIALRAFQSSVQALRPGENYAPRMEKTEALFAALMNEPGFKKRTLGGLEFSRDDKNDHLVIEKEKK